MKIPDSELDVLKALWELGPSPIKQLAERLYPDGGQSAYSTVQKLLERLTAKSCVRRRLEGRRHIYLPAVERADLIEHRLQETADQLCEGSMTPLLTQLVHSKNLGRTDLRKLRQLIVQLEESGGAKEIEP